MAKDLTRVFCIALALFLIAGAGLAATRFVSVSELSRHSQAVVRVKIEGFTSQVMETPQGPLPFIHYQARAISVLSGECPQTFTIRAPGLVTENRIITPPDSPPLWPGVEAVLFLDRVEGTSPQEAVFQVVGLAAGVLPVIPESPDHEARALLPVKSHPGPGAIHRIQVRLSDLSDQVKAARQNQPREQGP